MDCAIGLTDCGAADLLWSCGRQIVDDARILRRDSSVLCMCVDGANGRPHCVGIYIYVTVPRLIYVGRPVSE